MNDNYIRMQEFLDMLKEFAISNPDKSITNNFVYSNLIRLGVKSQSVRFNVVQQDYHAEWKSRYEHTNNLIINDNLQGSFCWFLNGYISGNEIKLYIPMDYEHIKEGANQLFDFISSTNMHHQSKIASSIRNDNVVVRVNSLEDAKKIVDFVSSNKYIQQGILSVNPFLPNCNGVGMVMDNNFSFNGELSNLLSNFIEWLKKCNRLALVTVEEFNKFIKFQMDNIADLDLKSIYSLLYKTTSKNFRIEDFFEHAINKLIDEYDEDRKRITDPEFYLEKAIKITEKYYPGNSKKAILEYLKSDSSYFTRKATARAGLVKYVKPRDLIPLMRKKLQENNVLIPYNDVELIDIYLNIVLNKQKKHIEQDNYVEQFEIIKRAFVSTRNVYGEEQAREAFRQLYLNSNISYFTNKYGDREKLQKQIVSRNIKKIILNNLDLNGINVNNIADVLHRFIQTLSSDYKKNNIY